jgi:hypothetical protein
MIRMTTTHAVADRNSRVASEEARISPPPGKSGARALAGSMATGVQTGSCPNKRASPGPDQYPIVKCLKIKHRDQALGAGGVSR